jgi:uncharacterized membrane protein YedE/YeeE
MRGFWIVVSGLLFGAGVTVSGMVNPMKVLNFMDLAGLLDPTLIFVMGVGLIVATVGYRLVFRRGQPFFDRVFHLPTTSVIDGRLIGGAALFGLGWGLSGFCPGPAFASLVFGNVQSLIFVVAMAAGMLLTRFVPSRSA